MPTMGKKTMNIQVTNPINFRSKQQVQNVTRTKKCGFSNPLNQTRRNKSIKKHIGGRFKVTLNRMSITPIN